MSELPRMITISEDGETVCAFLAPANKYVAREIWVFLVDNLRPGLVVELSLGGAAEITRVSGQKVPIDLYSSLMGDHNAESSDGIRK